MADRTSYSARLKRLLIEQRRTRRADHVSCACFSRTLNNRTLFSFVLLILHPLLLARYYRVLNDRIVTATCRLADVVCSAHVSASFECIFGTGHEALASIVRCAALLPVALVVHMTCGTALNTAWSLETGRRHEMHFEWKHFGGKPKQASSNKILRCTVNTPTG